MSDPQTPPIQSLPSATGTPRIHRHGTHGLSARSKDQQQRFARDIEWKVLGPIPVHTFLQEFFPNPPDPEVEFLQLGINPDEINFASVPNSPSNEKEMYNGICDNLNKIAEPCGLTFCGTSKPVGDSGVLGTVKPDIGLYNIQDQNRGHIMNFHKRAEDSFGDDAYFYVAHMGLVHLFIEVKKDADQDIFIDPPEGPKPPKYKFTVDALSVDGGLRTRISALGQNAHYAHTIQSRQFRTCVFSLSISGSKARILRWDRSGVLVTEAFDHKADPQILIDFVWRFVRAKDHQRGFDPTAATVNSNEDRDLFRKAISSHVQLQLGLDPETDEKELLNEIDRHYYPEAITRLTIGGSDVWVSRPLWQSHAIAGRCTAGYWGVLCDTREVVFVKDLWRTNVEEAELEGDILEDLREKGVRHIPTVVCHGDVIGQEIPQTTRTDTFTNEPWVKSLHPQDARLRRILPRIHYRLVTDTAGYPLSTFAGSRELLKGTFDGFSALMDAHEKAGTLHRDVALGNMILYRPRKEMERIGYLIDWELGCKLDKVTIRRHALTGTPAFMSFRALKGSDHVHSLADDLESFIYVVLYAALRWLPVKSQLGLHFWIAQFFSLPSNFGANICADMKLSNAYDRTYSSSLESAKSPQVVNWLKAAMDLHYKDEARNPRWDDGVALGEMWERTLAEDLPTDDRCVNPVPYIKNREEYSLHATYTAATSFGDLYTFRNEPPQPVGSSESLVSTQPLVPAPAKRPLVPSASEDDLDPAQAPKLSRTGKEPQTRSVLVLTEDDD